MYTVCPKCALTLVVSAADLRVAQGFVRCGRCSNVFNALARLSEDRNVAANAARAAAPAPEQSSPEQSSPEQSSPEQSSPEPSSPQVSSTEASSTSTPQTSAPAPQPAAPVPSHPSASAPPPRPSAPPAPQQAAAPPPADRQSDSIPETALEFNPEATDVTKLFVEQTPNPEWSAATGKFKALSRQFQAASAPPTPASSARPEPAARQDPAAGGELAPARQDSEPAPEGESQYEVEIDAEFLSIASRLTPDRSAAHRPEPVDSTGAQQEDSRRRTPASTVPPSPPESRVSLSPEPRAEPRPESRAAPGPVSRSRLSANTTRVARRDVGFADAEDVADTRLAARDTGSPSSATPSARATAPSDAPAESRLHYLWSAGTGALAILLLAQIVHHYRHDLAANARLYRPLTALYSALGVSLVPRWNLGSYDVRQLGASAETAGQITVRASVKNVAQQPQPLPLLRVTLQDRFGNRIAARDVPPESYLPRAIPSSSFLSPGQRIDAEMAFVDPGSNAVGFEIDACLPRPGGAIACANDASAHQ
jgi:predicted Zn finger-like uncharacterized protein